jgi:hypothetical protein
MREGGVEARRAWVSRRGSGCGHQQEAVTRPTRLAGLRRRSSDIAAISHVYGSRPDIE